MTNVPARVLIVLGSVVLAVGCGGASHGLNHTSATCPAGRTLLDGVCVAETVADYVACVRAQGAQLGGAKSEQISAEAGYLGAHAAAAADVRETLEKKYSVSDAATLEIIRGCNANVRTNTQVAAASTASPNESDVNLSGDWEFVCEGVVPARDIHHLQQSGSTLVSTSPRFSSFRGEGTLRGRAVTGRFTNVTKEGPAAGRYEYVLDASGRGLNGTWWYDNDDRRFKCAAQRK